MRAAVIPLFILVLLLSGVGVLRAQPSQQTFDLRLTIWNQTLAEVGRAADRPDLTAEQVEAQRARLADILSELADTRSESRAGLDPLRSQLDALGPPPAEGEPDEAADVARQREILTGEITALEGRIKQTGLIETKAVELDSRLSAYVRGVAVEILFERNPLPLAPSTIAVAVPEFFVHLAELLRAPGQWWGQLSVDQRDEVVYYRFAFILVFGFGFGWAARRLLLSRCGRDPQNLEPTYARRLVGAIAEGLGNGLIPALIFGGLLYRNLQGQSLFTGTTADMAAGFCLAMIVLFLVRALTRAALAPDVPAWRLEDIRPENARIITRRVTALAAVYAIDIFLVFSTDGLAVTLEMESLYGLVLATIAAVLLILLTPGRLWVLQPAAEPAPDDGDAVEPAEPPGRSRFWLLLRLAVVAVAASTVVTALLGYTNLSTHLLESLLISGGIAGGLYLIRGLLREVIGVSLRSALLQDKLALRHPTRNLIKFWTRALLDLVLLVLGVLLLLPVWGLPLDDMLRWSGRALQGITIGNVTLSLTDLLTGLLVFIAVVVLTRATQRVLSTRVLPQTTLDSGVQNSISAGLGYVGIALAAALAISTIGLDLSNLALIAGALSVGIGFGLQNVVNNFVSGLILLIERPIKVGDWIIAAGHEGYVKRINVRATELETFQRASVIIPNSELISSSVINWTHKNKLGRVEVVVGVSYDSDVDEVMDTLMACLKAESRILNWPSPYVVFKDFGASSLDFDARGYIADIEEIISITSDLRVSIARAFREKGIEIPFPQRDVNLRDIDRLVEVLGGEPRSDADAQDTSETVPPKDPEPNRDRPKIVGETDAGADTAGDGAGDGGSDGGGGDR